MKNNFEKIFNHPYDLNLFAKEVLSPALGSHFQMNLTPVPAFIEPNQTENKVIQKVLIYGKIELEDGTEITCYEIHLHENSKIEYSKVAKQRYVRKLLGNGQAALINFVNPTNKNSWRFTYIANERTINEKGERVSKLVNARRYTYLLGTSESCKTAAERFDILSNELSLTMETLTKAFSVEKLSKSFFDEYLQHYNNFVTYLTKSNFKTSVFSDDEKEIRDFSKKLLGRIVFLYFVQKKGWLGASDLEYKDGLQNFMTKFYNLAGANDSFYNNFLKILFFETLNKPRENDDFKMPDGSVLKIPFLNGGLFDKEKVDENILTFKPELFHSIRDEDNPKKRGFLDFLNAHNFTVYEDSPEEQTIAVAPEMLGHIFENLLEDNKDKGAYYTPKEIVHYMCQESLSEYLLTNYELRNDDLKENIRNLVVKKEISTLTKPELQEIDNLLDNVKICDPAIGSGAFPVGLLQEIFTIKEVIAYETVKEWNPAQVKENIIQNSIYGVDIEKGAVDIARLRFWLSLVVDEEKPKALPNLDYKIVVGNSLVSKFEDEIIEIVWKLINNSALKQSRPDLSQRISENTKNIQTAQYEFFHSLTDKNALKLKIRNHKIDLLETLIEIEKQILKENGINPVNATNKKQTVEITERKIKFEGSNRLLDKLNNLKKYPDKPLNYFDWQLDFPEVLNPAITNGNGNTKNSVEVENTNNQIQILNKQIDAINQYLKQQNINEHILNLQTNIVHSQIALIKEQLEQIEKKISQIYGELFKVESNIVKEPSLSFVYSILPINQGIKEINQKIEKINPKLQKENINCELGFDIVIGNPPYIALQRMTVESKKGLQSMNYKTFENTGDIYTLFYERGHQLLKEKGVLTYITSRQWLQAAYGKSLRKYLATQTNPIRLIDFGQCKLFKEATVFVNILLTQKNSNQNNLLGCSIPNNFDIENEVLNSFFKDNLQKIENLSENTWIISGEAKIDDRISKIGKPLKDWTTIEFYAGIKTGFNDAYHISLKDKNDLITEHSKSSDVIKPLLRGKDIKRYSYEYQNLFTLFIPWHFPLHNDKTISNSSEKAENEFIKQYPAVYNHLLKYKPDLSNRNQTETGIRYEWYALQRYGADFWENYEKPKIIWIEISDRANYAYDDKGMYLTNSAYFLTCKSDKISLKYLLALLNSKVADFYFSKRTARIAGGRMRYTKQFVEQIPIPELPLSEQQPFIKLTDYVLYLKEQKLTDSTDKIMSFYFEHIIDLAVYELFFKEDVKKAGYDIISTINKLPEINSKSKLEEIRNIYKELNNASHPIRNAVSLLKNHEPFKTIEATLNRKDQ